MLVEEMEEEQLLCLIRRVIAVFLSELNMQVMVCFRRSLSGVDELPVAYEQVISLQKYGFYIGYL